MVSSILVNLSKVNTTSNRTKEKHVHLIRSDQSLSRIRLFVTPWIRARQASLSITNSQSSLRPTSIESVMPSSHLILWCPLLLLPSIFPNIRDLSNELVVHRVTKILELQLQHQSFQWVFRIDFLWDWLVWSSCCPKDSQESSPATQFGSIKSSMLSCLNGPDGPALTSIHD